MAGRRISELPAVVTPVGTDEFVVNQAGISRKVLLNQLITNSSLNAVFANIRANNIWMEIAEISLSASTGATISGLNGNAQKMYKVIFEGFLAAGGLDRRIYIRPNGVTTGYDSAVEFIHSDGGAFGSTIETDTSGLWVGRNGWNRDANIFIDFTFGATTGRKRVGSGMATYHHDTQTRLFYRVIGGVWLDTATNITSLWFGPSGGTLTGILIVFALQ